jgi:uncharacterized membrane protein
MEDKKNKFVLAKDNYRFILIGLAITVIGFLLMIGGATDDPTKFNADEVFSPVRITLAPFLVIAGYVFVIYGIMKAPKGEE